MSDDGLSITYIYDTKQKKTGITKLLSNLSNSGINLRDIQTDQCGDDGQVLLSGELERILDRNLDKGLILDAHIAQNEEQRLIMWERREAAALSSCWRFQLRSG